MAPPGKHRELQPTGIGSWEGFANEDLKREVKKFADGIYGGDREVYKAFANSIFSMNTIKAIPVLGPLFAYGKTYANPQATLPIVMEFDLSLSAEERFRAYQGSYNAKGQLTGYLAQLAEQAYIELGWTRRSLANVTGAFSWQPPSNWNGQVPVITINKGIGSNGREIYVPTLLRDNNNELMLAGSDDTLYGNSLSDWSVDKFLGGKGQSNYIKKTGAELANIANKYFPGMKELGVEGLPPAPTSIVIGTDPTGAPQDQIDSDFDAPLASIPDDPSGDPRFPEAAKFRTVERLEDQNRETVKNFLRDQYNISGLDEGTRDFDFKMDDKGRITELGVFNIIDGQREQDAFLNIITSEGDADSVNNDYRDFKIKTLQQGGTGTFPATGAWAVPGFPQTGTSGTIPSGTTGTGSIPTGVPLGANLAVPGISMPGSLQQQALSRVPLSEYRAALPAAMPGGSIPLMRGLYETPLGLAQSAYSLATQTGGFSPNNIPGGTGAQEFQQYLGAQRDWRGDLQRGLAAIETVKQKIINGISPDQLSDPEKAIYESYIGGTKDDPYAGAQRELALRQQLTSMLPMPLRSSARTNLQNIYDQALATRPTTVGGMPQTFMYGGSGSPFRKMNPMQISASTPSVAQIPIGQSISMDTSTDNTAVTGTGVTKTTASDGSTITFAPTGDGVTSTATVSKSEPKSLGGTRRESWKDGSAMVKRAPDGSIMEVYLIEADGSKKVLQTGQGDPMKKWTDESAPSQPPPKVIPKPTPAPTPKPTGTPTPPPTWKAGQPLSEQYLAFLRQGGVSPTQVKELKETDMQTNDKSVPLVAPSNPLTPPKNITDKLKEIYDRDKMLQRFENYDYQVGKDLTWDPSNQDQFNLYMNQRVRQELGKAEQAKALANAQYMGAGGANLPPLTAPLPIPNTNLPYGYNNYIGFGGAKPPIIAANPAATAAAHAQWINQGKSNYNINKPTALDLANAFNYTMFPR